MPKIAFYKGKVFFFLSADRKDNRKQINVSRNDKLGRSAKFWIEPVVELAIKNTVPIQGEFTDAEIEKLKKLIEKNIDIFFKAWKNFEEGKKITPVNLK